MKKILSTLVMCLILGVGYSYGITVTAKAVVYDQTKSNSERVQGGGNVVVYVSNKYEKGWLGSSWSSWGNGTPNGIDTYSTWTGDLMSGGDKDGKVCYSASVENTSNGYYFYQWEETNGEKITEKGGWTNDRDIKNTEISADKTVYAVFKPVTVDNPNNGTISVTDIIPETIDGTVTFNVTGADNTNDFDEPIVEGEGFEYKSMSYANNVITVTVAYTVQNKDNVNGDPKPNYSATVTLRSKGDADGTQAKQATITATESLKPAFTIPATLDLTPDAPALTAAPAQKPFTITPTNQVAANASWDATLPQVAKDLGFSVETSATTVTVKFTPKDNTYQEDILATLSITGSYKDSNGKIITHTQNVSLSADKGSAVKIDGKTNASYDFGTKEYTGKAYTKDLSFTSNIATDLSYLWFPANFEHEVKGNIITITLPGKLIPGDYSGELSVKYNAVDVAYLTASAKVRLAQPQIESKVYMSQVLLTWKNVYGAKQYILKSGETVIDISDVMTSEIITTASTTASHTLSYSKMITAIGDVPLSTGTEYPFTLTVVYGDDVNNINDVTKISSTTITATPTATTTITASDVDLLGIYTGTEKAGAYPYHKDGKRLVDLSAAFKDDKAIFNQLFIFGLTTGDASNNITVPTATTNSNAVTPCYIYKKSGDNYVLAQTIENVNVATKPSAFNITASGQKIYFTGYAPYASCGYTYEDNGVFLFTNTVDVYLDNAHIFARPKADLGNVVTTHTYKVHSLEDAKILTGDDVDLDYWKLITDRLLDVKLYTQGSGSVFCFQSKSGNTTPKIHVRGNNLLESTEGVYIYVDIDFYKTMKKQARQLSSPIQILHNKNTINRTTTLTIDDIWDSSTPEYRTNGMLNLARTEYRPAPTIDLGNSNTTLNINGGQMFLSNSFNTSDNYTVTFAISYRQKGFELEGGHSASIYGIGDDQPGGSVNFNDGSINCKSLPISITESSDKTTKDMYERLFHNPTSMKCPLNTRINGGTFNCDVLACSATESKGSSPLNKFNQPLCAVDIPVTEFSESGTAVLESDWKNYAAQNGSNTDDLDYYGISSMMPTVEVEEGKEKQYVHLLLPSDLVCFKEEITTPWVVCFPETSVTTKSEEGVGEMKTTFSGEKAVEFSSVKDDDNEGLTTVHKTARLFYGQLDNILKESITQGYDAPGDITQIEISDLLFGEITNEEAYAVYDKVYMLMPVVANEWKVFVPPFSVSNVYVIESYPENKLLEDFGEDVVVNNKIKRMITESNIQAARYAQAHRMMDLCYQLIDALQIERHHSDIWSNLSNYPAIGQLTSMSEYMQEWMLKYMTDDVTYMPVIEQLYHYKSNNEGYPDKMSRWDANFYLYKATNEWGFDEIGQLESQWNEVDYISTPRNVKGENNVIMNKGEVYSICFPYSIYNDGSHNPNATWDYWTGKYVLLEGFPVEDIDSDGNGISDTKGQMISGSVSDWDGMDLYETFLSSYETSDRAVLRGNSTFSVQEVNAENVYVINGNGGNEYKDGSDHNEFVHYEIATLAPAEGFMLANAPKSSSGMPRRIESINPQTGDVTYRDETTTSLPTIGGNKHMMVYNIEGGVGIVPVVEQQVSIYNAAGQLVTSEYLTDEVHISLPTGIYLIAGAQDQFKAVVK